LAFVAFGPTSCGLILGIDEFHRASEVPNEAGAVGDVIGQGGFDAFAEGGTADGFSEVSTDAIAAVDATDAVIPPKPAGTGGVVVTRNLTYVNSQTPIGSAAARFFMPDPCTTTATTIPECVVSTCSPTGVVRESAGNITISGTTPGEILLPNASKAYDTKTAFEGPTFFSKGQDVTVSAAGGDVPSFQLTVTPPDVLQGVSPTPGAGGVLHITGDFTLSWGFGVAADPVFVTFSPSPTITEVCTFTAKNGATIPAAALTSIGASGQIEIGTVHQVDSQAGAYGVFARAVVIVASGTYDHQ
jgi:hypothetical protein